MLLLLLACQGPPDPDEWTALSAAEPWRSAPSIIPEDLDIPALSDVSVWQQRGLSSGRSDAGAFGLGNGRVFGLIGLDSPWNTLTNLIGPGYALRDGYFGDSALSITLDGQDLPPTEEAVQRPRHSALVRTWTLAGEASLTTTDLVAPEADMLLRHLTLRNEGDSTTSGLGLRVSLARAEGETAPTAEGALLQQRGGRWLRIDCPEVPASDVQASDTLDLSAPSLAPGQSWSVTCVYQLADAQPQASSPPAIEDLIEASLVWSQAALQGALQLQTPDPAVADLLDTLLITLLVQTDEDGVVSPMNRYTKAWLRDSEGPLRLYAHMGLLTPGQALLDAVYQSAVVDRSIANSYSLDLDLSRFEEPEDPQTFWEDADFMPSRNAAEAPSYAPLLYALLYARGGVAPDAARLAFLEACLRRQSLSPEGLLPFSGDETWRYPMSTVVGGEPEDLGWSPHSGFLYVAAAEALQRLGGSPEGIDAALAQQALETLAWQEGLYSPLLAYEDLEPWPLPYEDISLSAAWWGYPASPAGRLAQNLEATQEQLLREDGTLLSESLGGEDNFAFTGLVPGMWLFNASSLDPSARQLAFDAFGAAASLSGHFEELHAPDLRPLQLTHRADGMGGDISARYRPWEGGVAGDALLSALLGDVPDAEAGMVLLAPWLPQGWSSLSAQGLKVGSHSLDLSIEAWEQGWRLSLTHVQGEGPLTVTLRWPQPGQVWREGQPWEGPLVLEAGDAAELLVEWL